MKILFAFVLLAAGSAGAQEYRSYQLNNIIYSGMVDSLLGSRAMRDCRYDGSDFLPTYLSYYDDEGFSFVYTGECSSPSYKEAELSSRVKTNLPVGTYALSSFCTKNEATDIRKLLVLLSTDSLQVFLSEDKQLQCIDKEYPYGFRLKVRIH